MKKDKNCLTEVLKKNLSKEFKEFVDKCEGVVCVIHDKDNKPYLAKAVILDEEKKDDIYLFKEGFKDSELFSFKDGQLNYCLPVYVVVGHATKKEEDDFLVKYKYSLYDLGFFETDMEKIKKILKEGDVLKYGHIFDIKRPEMRVGGYLLVLPTGRLAIVMEEIQHNLCGERNEFYFMGVAEFPVLEAKWEIGKTECLWAGTALLQPKPEELTYVKERHKRNKDYPKILFR